MALLQKVILKKPCNSLSLECVFLVTRFDGCDETSLVQNVEMVHSKQGRLLQINTCTYAYTHIHSDKWMFNLLARKSGFHSCSIHEINSRQCMPCLIKHFACLCLSIILSLWLCLRVASVTVKHSAFPAKGDGVLSKFLLPCFITNLTPRPAAVNTGKDRHVFQVMLIVASIMAVGDDEAWCPLLRQYPVLQEAGHVQTQQQSAVILPHTHSVTVHPRPGYGYSPDSSHNHGAAVMSDVNSTTTVGLSVANSSHKCRAEVQSVTNSSHNHRAEVQSVTTPATNVGLQSSQLPTPATTIGLRSSQLPTPATNVGLRSSQLPTPATNVGLQSSQLPTPATTQKHCTTPAQHNSTVNRHKHNQTSTSERPIVMEIHTSVTKKNCPRKFSNRVLQISFCSRMTLAAAPQLIQFTSTGGKIWCPTTL